ncbi:DNA-deoxyinosine glycosylase [Methanococcoides sp.]|jgi:TDG/mug DNA glycosylase family protein|uniref:DNA-deoxyinosine glycosylase n=1 Tax=Methanococcoides sp. TaxID=1966350 RepID=UPI00272DD3AC|nr:DNA-deoxyinosine glycosylase [Methanococcoides sp.]
MEPMIEENTRILIVGTYPGQTSRDMNQYYANPRNQFWKIMKELLDIDLQELTYDEKIKVLRENQIGLWDTLKNCDVVGSSDKSICNEEYNDFSQLTTVERIVCNGKKAEKYLSNCNVPKNVEVIGVPSSSPARAMKFSEKAEEWKDKMLV